MLKEKKTKEGEVVSSKKFKCIFRPTLSDGQNYQIISKYSKQKRIRWSDGQPTAEFQTEV